jgi:hypothetical protein
MKSPGYQYRTTIDYGERFLVKRRTWVSVPMSPNSVADNSLLVTTDLATCERTMMSKEETAPSVSIAVSDDDSDDEFAGSTISTYEPSAAQTPTSGRVFRQLEEYIDGHQVIKEMVPDYMGVEYDILRKNCCSFARDACVRLGIPEKGKQTI